MTTRTTPKATPDSEVLLATLRELENAPLFQRGDAAMRFARLTVAAFQRLENRVTQLETLSDAQE